MISDDNYWWMDVVDLNDNFVLPQKTAEHKFIGSDVIMTSLTIIPSPRSEILA